MLEDLLKEKFVKALWDEISQADLLLVNGNQEIVSTNNHFLKSYELEKEDVVGRKLDDVIDNVLPHYMTSHIKEFVKEGLEGKEKKGVFLYSGNNYYSIIAKPLEYVEGKENIADSIILLGFRDSTRLSGIEKALFQAEERYTRLIERTKDIILVLDFKGNIIEVNPAIEKLGYTPEELTGGPFINILDKNIHNGKRHRKSMETGVEQTYEVLMEVKNRPDIKAWYSWNSTPFTDSEGKIIGRYIIGRDISYAKHLEEELKKLSVTDPLTGLYNFRFFQSRLDEEISKANRHNRPFSLIEIDVDHFKEYNDTKGHPEGDKALQEISKIMVDHVRRIDPVSRCGGDEFYILLPETKIGFAYEIAERIRLSVKEIYKSDSDPKCSLTLSIGIGEYTPKSLDHKISSSEQEEFRKRVDGKLYEAKKTHDTICR